MLYEMDSNVPVNGNGMMDDEVRTLFVSGLPMDIKPRELDLLFLPYRDYHGSLLKFTSKPGKKPTPVAFCRFLTRDAAEDAMHSLNGVKFDSDLSQTLRLEFARSNTKMTRKQASLSNMINATTSTPFNLPQTLNPNNALIQSLAAASTTQGLFDPWTRQSLMSPVSLAMAAATGFSNDLPVTSSPAPFPTSLVTGSPNMHLPLVSPTEVLPPAGSSLPSLPLLAGSQVSPLSSTSKLSHPPPNALPCNTIFVANLGTYTTEQELREVFGRCPGFRRVRLLFKGAVPVAFVEFMDAAYAHSALVTLQGFQLLSSERGGMRIEFARNEMGQRGSGSSSSSSVESSPGSSAPGTCPTSIVSARTSLGSLGLPPLTEL